MFHACSSDPSIRCYVRLSIQLDFQDDTDDEGDASDAESVSDANTASESESSPSPKTGARDDNSEDEPLNDMLEKLDISTSNSGAKQHSDIIKSTSPLSAAVKA